MVNDIISDMLTRIRNASLVKLQYVSVLKTKLTVDIATILKQEGFIDSFETKSYKSTFNSSRKKTELIIYLRYYGLKKKPYINILKRISKPGLRVYVNRRNIPKVLNGIGISILSTSQGLLTDREARLKGIGGEVLCFIC